MGVFVSKDHFVWVDHLLNEFPALGRLKFCNLFLGGHKSRVAGLRPGA